ncbi:MAG: hypothetical protein JNM84_13245 [Planctomycetes bacterium]|nr:hypothetical protein [Planctomycetota bacterium]
MRTSFPLLSAVLFAACASNPEREAAGLEAVSRAAPLELRVSLADVTDDQKLKEFGRDLAKRIEAQHFYTADGGYTLVFRPSARKTVPLHSIPSWAAERNLSLAGVEVIAFGRLVRATGGGLVGVQVALSLPGSGQRIPLIQGGAGDEARAYLELAASLRSESRDASIRGMLQPTGDGAGMTVQEYRFEDR